MNILIFGATGGTGRALVAQALEQGHTVTAFARNPAKVKTEHKNLRVAQGNIMDRESVEAAVQGQDAVLSALGVRAKWQWIVAGAIVGETLVRLITLSRPLGLVVEFAPLVLGILLASRTGPVLSQGTKHIMEAMEKLGLKRFVCESSLGVGDSKGQLGFLYDAILIPLLLDGIFADKEVQERYIRESKLEWVIVRPAVLSNGPRTGVYQSGFGANDSIKRKISRADVADFMLKQISDSTYLRKTPGLSY